MGDGEPAVLPPPSEAGRPAERAVPLPPPPDAAAPPPPAAAPPLADAEVLDWKPGPGEGEPNPAGPVPAADRVGPGRWPAAAGLALGHAKLPVGKSSALLFVPPACGCVRAWVSGVGGFVPCCFRVCVCARARNSFRVCPRVSDECVCVCARARVSLCLSDVCVVFVCCRGHVGIERLTSLSYVGHVSSCLRRRTAYSGGACCLPACVSSMHLVHCASVWRGCMHEGRRLRNYLGCA